jgi:hypothetical protein
MASALCTVSSVPINSKLIWFELEKISQVYNSFIRIWKLDNKVKYCLSLIISNQSKNGISMSSARIRKKVEAAKGRANCRHASFLLGFFSTLKVEETYFSET